MELFAPDMPIRSDSRRDPLCAALLLFLLLLLSSPACAAKVLIVADLKYAMVADMVFDIKESLEAASKEYSTADIKGKLAAIVAQEGTEVVVALGVNAVAEAMRLPASIPVVYGLVVVPPHTARANVTGVYLSPPVSAYVAALRSYFPGFARISVLASSATRSLVDTSSSLVTVYNVGSQNDLITTVNQIANARALLLLPDVNLLTVPVMSNVYLFSFKKNIPLLGVTEAHVKQGALFALVFDAKSVSRQIGDKVQNILNGADAGDLPASPPKKYHLFLNSNTAQKMGIQLPDEILKKAKRVY